MDQPKPKQFANQVIQQMVQHVVSDTIMLGARDYASIRVVFRKLGGSWGDIGAGDHAQLELLKNVVMAWGQARSADKEQPV
jgi:hypothetical protein